MKSSDLTQEQLEKIADLRPDWMADNRPSWVAKNWPGPEGSDVPEEIMELLG